MANNLILTGWGYAEYAASAAVALKGLGPNTDVRGVSRRRLPELLAEIGANYKRIVMTGVSLEGDVPALSEVLKQLKAKGVKVVWISAFEVSELVRGSLAGLLIRHILDASLLEAVGDYFKLDVTPWMPYLGEAKKNASRTVAEYRTLFEAAQFYYRNYQDEEFYATAVQYLAAGVDPASWSVEVRRALVHYDDYGGRELIGKSEAMRGLQDLVNRVAQSDARVLILGESGTGKETVAQQIHYKSARAKEPFVPFNCASVDKGLVNSWLFGHEKGSFTGADGQHAGVFEQAEGGTLFLDEIGKMPLETQGHLLRVLEGGRYRRVGGTKEIRSNVRLITATNADLVDMVRRGEFLPDLYMRLNVVPLRMPALREHKEDIPSIANAWWRRHHGNRTLSEQQVNALADYSYPGNVRELINLLERASALDESDFERLVRENAEMNAGLLAGVKPASSTAPDELDSVIRLHVRQVYEKYEKNTTRAAKALKVSRNTLRKYL